MKLLKFITCITILMTAFAFTSCDDDIWVENDFFWDTPSSALPMTDGQGVASCSDVLDMTLFKRYEDDIWDYELNDVFLTISSKYLDYRSNVKVLIDTDVAGRYESGKIPLRADGVGATGFIDIRDENFRIFMDRIFYQITKTGRPVRFKMYLATDLYPNKEIYISLEAKLNMKVSR